jgi:hypothetical protein
MVGGTWTRLQVRNRPRRGRREAVPPRLLYWPRFVRGPFSRSRLTARAMAAAPHGDSNPGDGCDIAEIILAKNACFER